MKSIHQFLLLSAILLVFSSCQEDDTLSPDEQFEELKAFTVAIMKSQYLWNDKVPDVDINQYNDLNELMDAMTYKPLDRWSYISEKTTFDRFFRQGEYTGFGFSMRFDDTEKLWVAMVYPGSPSDEAGLKRGMQITAINGKPLASISDIDAELGVSENGIQASLTLLTADNQEKTVSMAKRTVEIKSVIKRSVMNTPGGKIGYMMFNHFIENSNAELDEAFSFFQSEGIDELVVDLRYNGGGLGTVARRMTSVLAPASANGQKMLTIAFNEQQAENNLEYDIEPLTPELGLERIVFITTDGTASASELVINCLNPYMDVVVIGQNSYGKPVGSSSIEHENYIFSHITLRVANAEGSADYFDGLPVNSVIPDDIQKDFGDPEEACLKEALYYFETGGFTNAGSRLSRRVKHRNRSLYRGFRSEIGAF